MSHFQTILMWISAVAASVLSVVGLGIWCDRYQVFPGRRLLGAFRRLPWPVQFFLLAFSLHLIVHGSIKTNAVGEVEGAAQQRGRGVRHAPYGLQDDVQQRGRDILVACNKAASAFFSRDRNVASPLYEIPQPEAGRVSANAELTQNWWRRGCWEDWRTVTFEDGWVFPHGSNHLSQVVVMSQGEILAGVWDTLPLASLGARVALVPFDTCFYHEHTPSNSYRFVWDRAYIERSTDMPMCATIELFRNGDYTVTTNGYVVERFVHEPPFPHVGIGQDEDWVRANFTRLQALSPSLANAADILSVGYANWVDAQVGVDLTNGLYKFTASFPDDPPEAAELVVGDLSVCVTNAGEYVFVLEKGVEYDFGTNPYDATVEYSMQDDVAPLAPVFVNWWWGDDNGVWTVDGGWQWISIPTIWGFGYCMWLPKFHGSPDVAHLGVADFPMTFEAVLSDCCHTNGVTYHWSTSEEGVNIVSPYAQATEVYVDSLPSWKQFAMMVETCIGGETLCSTIVTTYGRSSVPTSGISINCPDAVVINECGECPDGLVPVVVNLFSDVCTSGTMRVAIGESSLHGKLWVTSNRTERVVGSWSRSICDEMEVSQTFYFEPQSASDFVSQGAITAIWEPANGTAVGETNAFTVVSVKCEPVNSEPTGAGVLNSSGVTFQGGSAMYRVMVLPSSYPDNGIVWTASHGAISFVGGNVGRTVTVAVSDPVDGLKEISASIGTTFGSRHAQGPAMPIKISPTMTTVALYPYVVVDETSSAASEPVDYLSGFLPEINRIFSQAGVRFVKGANVQQIFNSEYLDIDNNGNASAGLWSLTEDVRSGIRLCLIRSIPDAYRGQRILGKREGGGILLCADGLTAQVLAHELGHAAGWDDVYYDDEHGVVMGSALTKAFMPDDWNASGNIGYYSASMNHAAIIDRLLMCGVAGDNHVDIPCGEIYGYSHFLRYESLSEEPRMASSLGLINVGWSGLNRNFTGEIADEELPLDCE